MSTGKSNAETVVQMASPSGRLSVVRPEKSSENAKPSRGGHRWALHTPFNPPIVKAITQLMRSLANAGYLTHDLPRRSPPDKVKIR